MQFLIVVIAVLVGLSKWGQAADLETKVQTGIQNVLPSVVSITTQGSSRDSFGSGFLVNAEKRWVLTNYHVIAKVTKPAVLLNGAKERLSARVISFDAKKDIALLEVAGTTKLGPNLKLGKTKNLYIGQFVLAAGNPGGFSFSASMGIISALNRVLPDDFNNVKYIQVDAPMYHGSSGGPLTNLKGEVVGMVSRGGANGAAGFAVPATDLKAFLAKLESKPEAAEKKFHHLGAVFQTLTEGFRKHFEWKETRGVLISGVYKNSAAETGGLRAGDILQAVGELELTANSAGELGVLQNNLSSLGAGPHRVKLVRAGKSLEINIALSENEPCRKETGGDSKVSFSSHKNGSCYWNPRGEFVEITRFWSRPGERNESPRRGDLLISLGSDRKPASYLSGLDHLSNKKVLGRVIRDGKPRLVLLPVSN